MGFRRPFIIKQSVAQHVHAFGRGELECAAREVGLGVQAAEGDGSLVAEAVFQLHGGEVVAFEADADVLVSGVVFLRRCQDVVDAVGRTVFFEGVTAVKGGFVGEDGGRAVADGLVLGGLGHLCQINVIEPNGLTVAYNGLFVGLGVFPFEEARTQDFESAVCGLGFLFALDGLGEAAADAVGVVVELFECIHCARLCETDGCGQGGSSEKFEQVVLFHHYFSLLEGVWRPVSMLQNNNASRLWAVYILQTVFPEG